MRVTGSPEQWTEFLPTRRGMRESARAGVGREGVLGRDKGLG